jgi:hypothetical protein
MPKTLYLWLEEAAVGARFRGLIFFAFALL